MRKTSSKQPTKKRQRNPLVKTNNQTIRCEFCTCIPVKLTWIGKSKWRCSDMYSCLIRTSTFYKGALDNFVSVHSITLKMSRALLEMRVWNGFYVYIPKGTQNLRELDASRPIESFLLLHEECREVLKKNRLFIQDLQMSGVE